MIEVVVIMVLSTGFPFGLYFFGFAINDLDDLLIGDDGSGIIFHNFYLINSNE